ncbi:MAG: HAD-IB family hydrolase [Bacteroidales bacterium]|nr:HAD-IB family hydrolase [Bacteroidales bacterium]MBK7628661.1 HAD-IB family hydrolase [Bacteroidales bacterium]
METTSSNVSHSGIKYIAFFDLDRTIISENSGKILIQQAYRNGLISKRYVLWGTYLSLLYKLKLKDPVIIIKTITRWLKGTKESELKELAAEIFNSRLKKSIRPLIEEKIRLHKKNGARVVILSSSVFPVCSAVAEYLNMDDVICTQLETENGIFTGRPDGSFCFNEAKVERLTSYCEINNTSLKTSWYYGDSTADLPALGIVGNPVCVDPDKKLRRKAIVNGWEIIS